MKLFSLLVTFFVLFSGAASAADCSKEIDADKPLWGDVGVGTLDSFGIGPVVGYQNVRAYGPGIKYTYVVVFPNSLVFKSWFVSPKDGLLRPGYKFAWVPVKKMTKYEDGDQFVPTAYNERCQPIPLGQSWRLDDLVGSIH